MTELGWRLAAAIKQQRAGVASSIIAAIVLIWMVDAPAVPVIAGCFVALGYIVLRSRAKLLSMKKDD